MTELNVYKNSFTFEKLAKFVNLHKLAKYNLTAVTNSEIIGAKIIMLEFFILLCQVLPITFRLCWGCRLLLILTNRWLHLLLGPSCSPLVTALGNMRIRALLHKTVRKFSTCGDVAGSAAERLRLLHKTFANCFPARKACGPPQFISRNSVGLALYVYWCCM